MTPIRPTRKIRAGACAACAMTLALAVGLAGGLLGCSSRIQNRDAAGTPVGGALGRQPAKSEHTPGARAGDVVFRYMDRQARELSAIPAADVQHSGDAILLTLDAAELFDMDSAQLRIDSRDRLRRMAEILIDYAQTDLIIAGHTDSEGDEHHNQKLSERRAVSVRNYLIDMGVATARVQTVGYGELYPIASNQTSEGRARNRRVEIQIRASEALRTPRAGNG